MTFSVVTVLALAAGAVALPAPQPWCNQHSYSPIDGSPVPNLDCFKAKRAPQPWCNQHSYSPIDGSPVPNLDCFKIKRAIAALDTTTSMSDILARDLASDVHPTVNEHQQAIDAHAKAAVSELNRLAAYPDAVTVAATEHEEAKRWCDRPGESCWKAKRWCDRPGESCWKVKRSEEDDAATHEEAKRWCDRPGESCWKVKRAAESILEATKDVATPAEAVDVECGEECQSTKARVADLRNVARAIVDEF